MPRKPFEFALTDDGEVVRIGLRGRDVLSNPMINFGTAFSHQEREQLEIVGLLPPQVMTIDQQLKRVYLQYSQQPDALSKYVYLNTLHNRNETLFYRLLTEHIEEMLPIVYTPTIGEAIQVYSHWFHRPRGVFLNIDDQESMEMSLRAYGHTADEVDLIVATDSEGILGIGDQGIGGVSITVGKLAVYTAAAGIHPHRVLPVVLDVGTDNLHLLSDQAYLGVRHPRVRGERYDEFIDRYVQTATKLFPHALLHWEDFGASNAHRILNKYRHEICTFNDDIQGTAAVVVAGVMAGLRRDGKWLKDQRIVISGMGTAGAGIADLLVDIMVNQGLTIEQARKRFWGLGSKGLIRDNIRIRDFQQPYARNAAETVGWNLDVANQYQLADVVRNVQPTILIGTSAQPGSFTQEICQMMASFCEHPIIMPLSNPTVLSEAQPVDIMEWTKGKAYIATGSPFAPVSYGKTTYQIAQANNALVFPGIGLGVAVCQASRVTDSMIAAAALAVAEAQTDRRAGAAILPGMDSLRSVSASVALAVIKAAQDAGVATKELESPIQAVHHEMWVPDYPKVEVIVEK